MERAPTPLHRVAAWCTAALAFAVVLVGTRGTYRALRPEARAEVAEVPREATELVDVEDQRARDASSAERAADVAIESSGSVARTVPVPVVRRRAVHLPGDEPMEKHPYFVIEGHVCSASGRYRERMVLEVEHPDGAVAKTDLHFDRQAPDGSGWIATFKLIKPAQGGYILRPRLQERWPYAVTPDARVARDSVEGLVFMVRDDVEHVDLDVVVLGAQAQELPRAHARWMPTAEAEGFWTFHDLPVLEAGRGPELSGLPVGSKLSWWAVAPGHRPALGEYEVVGGEERLELRLQPGWGAFLVEIVPIGDGPIGEVWIDGEYAGPTDPSGITPVDAHEAPHELRVWFVDHWAFDLQAGQVDEPLLPYRWSFRSEGLDRLPPPGN